MLISYFSWNYFCLELQFKCCLAMLYMAVLRNAYAIFLNKSAIFWINHVLSNGLNVFKADISRAWGSEGAPREIPGLLGRGAICVRNCTGSVLEEATSCFSEMQRQTEKFRVWMEKLTHLDTEENKPLLESRELKMQLVGQSIALSGAYMQVHSSPLILMWLPEWWQYIPKDL